MSRICSGLTVFDRHQRQPDRLSFAHSMTPIVHLASAFSLSRGGSKLFYKAPFPVGLRPATTPTATPNPWPAVGGACPQSVRSVQVRGHNERTTHKVGAMLNI